MMGADLIAVAVLVLILGGAIAYIMKEKKRGVKCVGCPYADSCAAKAKKGTCSCQEEEKE